MSLDFIDTAEGLERLGRRLETSSRFAVDLEAAGFHRYSDRICLLQVTDGDQDFVVDTLAVDPTEVLRGPLTDPSVFVLVHGADYDMRLLDRDFGLHLKGVFDTQIAAQMLGEPSIGLAALLEKYLDVKVSKKHQRADWARRPLPDDMLEYAASDTRYLRTLSDIMLGKVREAGREAWVAEECQALEALRWTAEEVDPVTRFKTARSLSDREVHRLRTAWEWRDAIAKRRDRALFRVAGDPVLLALATERPRTIPQMLELKGMPERLAKQDGAALLESFDEVDALSEESLVGYPPRPRGGGRPRPTPEVEERFERLKTVRNQTAGSLGLEKGTLIANGLLLEIAWTQPESLEELVQIEGVRRWQAEEFGARLLEAVRDPVAPAD